MLLICPRCQNTYTLDDQIYAQQGALCQTCMEPLVPMQDNGYDQNAQWGNQPQYDAQWGNQPQGDAQWGNQPQYDAQWGNQPQADAQWGNQPQADAQWGNQPQYDAQWGNQPQADAQWGNQPQADAQWGNQPQYDAQWGNQPQADAQWGGQQAQWGNQPNQNQWGGQQAQWGNAPQQGNGYDPMPTLGLNEDAIQSQSQVPNYNNGNNERTVALDLADVPDPAALMEAKPANPAPVPTNPSDDEGWGDAWGGEMPSKNPPKPAAPVIPANQTVVGTPMMNMGNDQKTRQIDCKDVQRLYGDKVNPILEFYRSLPKKALYIAGGILAFALIIMIFIIVDANQPEKIERDITADGDIVIKGTPEKPITFKEIVAKTKAAIPSIMPLDGPDADTGIVIGISKETGVTYNNNKIASLSDFQTRSAFISKIYQAVMDDKETPSEQPIILLFEESIPMSTVYQTLYSFYPTRRQVLLGGTTTTGITTLEISPGDWPDHDGFVYLSDAPANTQLKVTLVDMTMRRTATEDSLMINEEGEPIYELRDSIRGGKVYFQELVPALAKFRAAKQTSILLTTDGDVNIGLILTIAQKVYGDPGNPNVKRILLDTVPLS